MLGHDVGLLVADHEENRFRVVFSRELVVLYYVRVESLPGLDLYWRGVEGSVFVSAPGDQVGPFPQ